MIKVYCFINTDTGKPVTVSTGSSTKRMFYIQKAAALKGLEYATRWAKNIKLIEAELAEIREINP